MSLERTASAQPASLVPGAPDAPKSSAWLEAERLFAQRPTALPEAAAAVVVVKRSRVALAKPGAAAPGPDKVATAESQTGAPRVFRLVGTRTDAAAQPEPAAPVPQAGPMPRRRLPGAARRSGPVVVRMVSAPARPPAPLPTRDEPTAAAPVPGSRALAESLAAVTPILAAIQTARAFRFIDEHCAAEWRRLSQAADRLMAEIRRGG